MKVFLVQRGYNIFISVYYSAGRNMHMSHNPCNHVMVRKIVSSSNNSLQFHTSNFFKLCFPLWSKFLNLTNFFPLHHTIHMSFEGHVENHSCVEIVILWFQFFFSLQSSLNMLDNLLDMVDLPFFLILFLEKQLKTNDFIVTNIKFTNKILYQSAFLAEIRSLRVNFN